MRPTSQQAFPPVVAGRFYPGEPEALRRQIDELLARAPELELPEPLLGLMIPHAGYRYSGLAAAHGYRQLAGRPVKLVVVLAPSHRVPAGHAATLDRPAYATPLGAVPLAQPLARQLVQRHPFLRFDERLFAQEHSLEVQLPFLQRTLPDARVLPIVLGTRSPKLWRALAGALNELLGKRTDALVIASSDLSHYEPYAQCRELDAHTLQLVTSLDPDALSAAVARREAHLCGSGPVATLMELAREQGGAARKLFWNNSGDTAGDRKAVVGYGVVAFGGAGAAASPSSEGKRTKEDAAASEEPYELTPKERAFLLHLAKTTVEQWVRERSLPRPHVPEGILTQPGAAFVTLRKGGRLRGCIGHTQARQPLWECVRSVASSAATEDPRFRPVSPEELGSIQYEVSVLTPLRPLARPLDVRVGTDGLMVRWQGRRGLLLPQVPGEFGWGKREFLAHTCRKAGLPLDCWQRGARFERFQALVFGEGEGAKSEE